MGDEEKKEALTRRGFLGASSAALAAATMLSAKKLAAQEQSGQKPKSDRSASDPGPTNPALDAANPDSNSPVPTDAGAVTTFKCPFSFAHKRLQEGGWSREVTQRELSISKTLAGVDMRLTAGGCRELHWHSAAEWALMLYGTARITCIDADGKSFVTDIKENDLWFFPAGYPHSIQGLAPDGCEFLLVFDEGTFSEYQTFLLSDWLVHTEPEILAQNLRLSSDSLAKLPKDELYIFPGHLPGSLEDDKRAVGGKAGESKIDYTFRMAAMQPTKENAVGSVRIVDSSNFPPSKAVAAALVTVKPGGIRELHWHPNASEWQYYIKGSGRMTVFASSGKARTMDFNANEVGFIPAVAGHFIENTGSEDLVFLETLKSRSH